jgi:hypothetical protein
MRARVASAAQQMQMPHRERMAQQSGLQKVVASGLGEGRPPRPVVVMQLATCLSRTCTEVPSLI